MTPNFNRAPHCIDVWGFKLTDDNQGHIDSLDEKETARANRFLFPHHRQRFIESHLGLRAILAKYVSSDPKALIFDTHTHGKPFLVNDPLLKFNLSHSGDYALVAVGFEHELGVDIERYSTRPYDDMARELFTEDEQAFYHAQTQAQKPATFFTFWSQKEAFIKAIGLGLRYPPHLFSTLKPLSYDDTAWFLQAFKPYDDYYAALCYQEAVTEIRRHITSV